MFLQHQIVTAQNEKATRQLRQPFLQGRIVLTEKSTRQNFLAKSYEPKKRGVKDFLRNKYVCFQLLRKDVNRGLGGLICETKDTRYVAKCL